MILAGIANRMDLHDVITVGSSGIRPHEATSATLSLSNTVPHAIRKTLHAAGERRIADNSSRYGHAPAGRWTRWHYTGFGTTGLEN